MDNLKIFLLPFLLLLLLSYWSVSPLFLQGFFPVHDDTQVARVFEMKKSLSDGMFPVRWVADLGYGYGYPIFNFYGPFAYYVGGFLALLLGNSLLGTKLMMGIGIILAGLSMYLLANEFWGKRGGVISGLLYLYAPYHAVNIYIRGDVAEFYAYAFLPVVFYAIWKIYQTEKFAYMALGSAAYALIILSHNLTALMVSPFIAGSLIFFFLAKLRHKKKMAFNLLLIFPLGILLAAFYWLPVFVEMQYTNVLSVVGGGSDYKDHFLCISQLWNSPWGFGGSAPGCLQDGLSFKIGKLHIILFFLSFYPLWKLWRSDKVKSFLPFLVAVYFFVAVWLMLDASKLFWDSISTMSFFQFPWRFLIIATFCVSFLGGAVIWWLDEILAKRKLIHSGFILVWIMLAVVIINQNYKIFAPQTINNNSDKEYISREELTWRVSKISDEYMPVNFKKPENINEIPVNKLSAKDNVMEIVSQSDTTTKIQAEVVLARQTPVTLAIAYFPAWKTYVDGELVLNKKVNSGMEIVVPKGRHVIEARFEQTFIEKIGNSLTIAGVIVLFLGIISHRKQKKHGKKSS